MDPAPGDRLLHYRLVERIGAGGMGVVWRATDTKLGRDVAIKILPPALADDGERLARFEQEARSLAALSHPNIAQVHGLERDSSGVHFIALEWVPGEDLAAMLARGPLPPRDAIAIGRQIAAGLEAAHERGIVHRDLKPANVRITPAGTVKLLDFGLAKTIVTSSPAADPTASPTVTSDRTVAGTILGTAAYMSPEQARGAPVDRRTDIWAFGCVMLELLTGVSPFRRDTVSETLAAVLEREPDLDGIPDTTPRAVGRMIRRCLRKDTGRRLRDIGDASLDLDEGDLRSPAERTDSPRRRAPAVAWLAALFVVAAAGWWVGSRVGGNGPRPARATAHLSVVLPGDVVLDHGELPGLAMSPDGSWIAFVGRDGDGTRLFLRPLDRFVAEPVAETDGAIAPFFSSDGRWVAFQRRTELWKVPVTGGAPTRIAGVPPIARGYDWARPDEITLTWSKRAGLYGLSVSDGSIRAVTSIRRADDEVVHNWAQALPGGEVLATVVGADAASYDEGRIVMFDTDDGARTTLIEGGYYGRLPADDILLYVRAGILYAVRVDVGKRETVGQPVPVFGGFLTDPNTGSAWFDVSDDGVLTYATGGTYRWQSGRLVWIDRDGTVEPVLSDSRPYRFPRISPDGTRVVFTVEAVHDDVWLYELERGAMTRLTFDKRNVIPIWRPGTDEISFTAVGADDARPSIYSLKLDGRSTPTRLVDGYEGTLFCNSWSPDGTTLAFVDWNGVRQFDILLAGDGGTAEPEPFATSRFDEHSPVFSPDGAWIAYVSNESGEFEVYVAPAAGGGARYQVSPNGGVSPVWNPAGGELFYREGPRLMVVDFGAGAVPSISLPRALFDMPEGVGRLYWVTHFDVSPDGRRFLAIAADPVPGMREIRVVQGWLDDVEAALDTEDEP